MCIPSLRGIDCRAMGRRGRNNVRWWRRGTCHPALRRQLPYLQAPRISPTTSTSFIPLDTGRHTERIELQREIPSISTTRTRTFLGVVLRNQSPTVSRLCNADHANRVQFPATKQVQSMRMTKAGQNPAKSSFKNLDLWSILRDDYYCV